MLLRLTKTRLVPLKSNISDQDVYVHVIHINVCMYIYINYTCTIYVYIINIPIYIVLFEMIYTPFTVKLEPLLKFSDENICLPWLKLWVPSAAWSGLGVGRAQNTLNGF